MILVSCNNNSKSEEKSYENRETADHKLFFLLTRQKDDTNNIVQIIHQTFSAESFLCKNRQSQRKT